MTKEDVIAIIEEYNSKNKASFTVSNHRHNGSDTNRILMGDLLYDNRGLIFPTSTGNIVWSVDTPPTGNSLFNLIPPSDTELVLGSITPFKKITSQAEEINNFVLASAVVPNTRILDFVDDTVENSSREMYADYIDIQSTATGSTGWYLKLPDNTVLPAAPAVGSICIFGGILQVCEVAGVWTPK